MDRWNWLLLTLAVAAAILAFLAASTQCIPACAQGYVCEPGCPEAVYAAPLSLLVVGLLALAFIRAGDRTGNPAAALLSHDVSRMNRDPRSA